MCQTILILNVINQTCRLPAVFISRIVYIILNRSKEIMNILNVYNFEMLQKEQKLNVLPHLSLFGLSNYLLEP